MSSKLASAFLDKLQRSGLVSGDKIPALQQDLEERGVGLEDPYAIAEALVDNDTVTRWQADKLLEGKHKGFFLASYRLLRPLGKGGMGAVFLARHEMMRRQCALKVLPHTQAREATSVLERFYVEAQAVAALDHPNIVRAYDVNKEIKDNKEIHYLVMEYVEGQDLQVMVNERGGLDYITAADYIRQTANGLAHAHENKLVHRDIKPANLLVDTKGVVKILDLGLARLTHDDSEQASLTAAYNETVLGTADYLSPEQALNSHDVDHRTDLYSLGCTAYFMLTGHPPFPEGTVAQRLVAHQVKSPDPISEKRPDAPADLVAIIDQMMTKDPKDRYQTAADVTVALSAWLLEHGGEDWKRQHSEIVGDSALMKILSQREPTRAMRSPMSETELELAPIDDDEKKQSSGKSGSAAAGGSPAEEISLLLDEEEDAPAPIADEQPPTTEEPQELDSQEAEEPSPDLSDEGGLSSLDEAELLGSLDSLESEDLLDVADIEDPLGAIQSDLKLSTTAGPQSSTTHQRVAAAQPRSLADSIKSVGLPIVIGVGGGLLVVLIIILLILYGPSGGPEPMQRPYVPPDSVAQVPDDPSTESPQKPAVERPEPKQEQVEPKPAGGNATEKPVERPSEPDERATTQPQTEKPAQPEPQVRQRAKTPKEGGGNQVSIGANKPPDMPADPATITKAVSAKGAETKAKPAQAAPPSEEQLQGMLAGIRELRLEVRAGGTSNKKSKQPQSVTPQLALMINQKFTETANHLKWKPSSSDQTILTITVTPKIESGYAVVEMSGELKRTDNNSNVHTVWTHPPHVIARFGRGASQNTVNTMARKEVGKFFSQLERDHKAAAP